MRKEGNMPIDYKKYPANWKTEIVPSVIKRSGDCCEHCGLVNKMIVYSVKADGGKTRWMTGYHPSAKRVKVVLTVAHLDHDESNKNVKIERLMALCQRCHLRYDSIEKARRRKEKGGKNG
jgi:5-methylcytosine-specific restriction endonuclease McrA